MTAQTKNLLAVVAHPDDEITMGGTLARYARTGTRVTLVCTTNGAGGTDPEGLGQEKLARNRQEELRRACKILGVTRLELLEDRERLPNYLTRLTYAAEVQRHCRWVGEILEEIRPDVVVTFGPEGVTGHPTHIMVGHLTTLAVLRSTAQPRLYNVAFSAGQVFRMMGWFESHPSALQAYFDAAKVNPRLGSDAPALFPVAEEEISVAINVADVLAIKLEALRCHRSQGGDGGILEAFGADDTEHFVRVLPPKSTSEPRESDLFA